MFIGVMKNIGRGMRFCMYQGYSDMTMDEKIKRINELYHKSKAEGLTPEEKAEQAALRQDYVNSIKANLSANLENVRIQEADGTIRELRKKHGQ